MVDHMDTTDTTPARHTVFMHVRTTVPWLALAPSDRFGWLGQEIVPILQRHPRVRLRFFDSEAFSAEITDVLMWETDDVMAYQALVEELRETQFWGHYFEIRTILPAIENAFEIHYGQNPLDALTQPAEGQPAPT
jgi:hypothetical protein